MGLIVNPAHGHDRKGKERGKTPAVLYCLVGQPSLDHLAMCDQEKGPGSYQNLDLFIKVLWVLCPNLTDDELVRT